MAKSQIDLMPIALAAGAYLAYQAGLLDPILVRFGIPPRRGGTLPPGNGGGGGGGGLTEDQAALVVARNQSGLCQTMSSMSNGFWNCSSDTNKIATMKQWFYKTDPTLVPQYGTLANYVKQMGWS